MPVFFPPRYELIFAVKEQTFAIWELASSSGKKQVVSVVFSRLEGDSAARHLLLNLHLLVNDRVQLRMVCVTPGNTHDRKPVRRLAQEQQCFSA